MYRKSSFLIAALTGFFLALPAAATAQQESKREHGRYGAADMLLEHRSDLKLSDDQVKRLEAVRAKYEKMNQPLVEQVSKLWGDRPSSDSLESLTPEQRRQLRAERKQRREEIRKQNPEVETAMNQLRDNRKAARKEALAILTPEQQQIAKQRMAKRHGEWRGKHRGHRERGAGQPDSSGA
ncbi:MAG: Spy/CpxP family protein refolding chaperone [Gemmatimonadales bacterium]